MRTLVNQESVMSAESGGKDRKEGASGSIAFRCVPVF